MKQETVWFVYIIQTTCGKFYTGITTDIARRFREHFDLHEGVSAKGAKFFRGHKPEKIVFSEQHTSRSEATKRECQIKALSAARKKILVNENQNIHCKSFKIENLDI